MNNFLLPMYYKYVNFITINWSNLLPCLAHNLLILAISIVVILILAIIISKLDDINNTILYIIGKIISVPIMIFIIIFTILALISFALLFCVFMALIGLLFISIVMWFFSLFTF